MDTGFTEDERSNDHSGTASIMSSDSEDVVNFHGQDLASRAVTMSLAARENDENADQVGAELDAVLQETGVTAPSVPLQAEEEELPDLNSFSKADEEKVAGMQKGIRRFLKAKSQAKIEAGAEAAEASGQAAEAMPVDPLKVSSEETTVQGVRQKARAVLVSAAKGGTLNAAVAARRNVPRNAGRVLPSETLGDSLGGPLGATSAALDQAAVNVAAGNEEDVLRPASPPDGDMLLNVLEQAAKESGAEAQKPCLYYSPFAGRAELTRLIAAVGGLEIDEKELLEDKNPFASPGSWPCLEHGGVKIAQSFAIETYIASITPAFSALTPAERAIDNMFCKIKEDVYQCFANIMNYTRAMRISSTMSEDAEASTVEEIGKVADTWFPTLEARLPKDAFINGFSFPTVADLAVLNMCRAFMPFSAVCAMGGYDIGARFPRLEAHAARVAAFPDVRAYLDRSATMDADPFGMRNVRLRGASASFCEAYKRDPSWMQSATTEGRAVDDWAANVLGALARETPVASKRRKKPNLKRLSSSSIMRALGCAPHPKLQGAMLLGCASSPSVGATNSICCNMGSNSIRSQLTSPADSDWMVRSTWTPPSPPAPSSARTEQTDRSMPRSSSLPMPALNMPATGLRLSPCNSASSHKALAANIARSVVPGLDLTRVHMGYDEDEDTEDDPSCSKDSKGVRVVGSYNPSDVEVTSGTWKADVPQLDMSTVGHGEISPQNVSQPPSSLSYPSPAKVANSYALTPPKGYSQSGVNPMEQGQTRVSSSGDLRPVVPGARESFALSQQPARDKNGVSLSGRPTGYPDAPYGYTVNVDTTGHVVAGGAKKNVLLGAPVGVRLPPVAKLPKGNKSKGVSHVHMHHHLHYHVNKAAAESYM